MKLLNQLKTKTRSSLTILAVVLLSFHLQAQQIRKTQLYFTFHIEDGIPVFYMDIPANDTILLISKSMSFCFKDPYSGIERSYKISTSSMEHWDVSPGIIEEKSLLPGTVKRYAYAFENAWHIDKEGWITSFSIGEVDFLSKTKTKNKQGWTASYQIEYSDEDISDWDEEW